MRVIDGGAVRHFDPPVEILQTSAVIADCGVAHRAIVLLPLLMESVFGTGDVRVMGYARRELQQTRTHGREALLWMFVLWSSPDLLLRTRVDCDCCVRPGHDRQLTVQ